MSEQTHPGFLKIQAYLEEIKKKPDRIFELEQGLETALDTWLVGQRKPKQILARNVFTLIPYIDKLGGINRLGQAHVLFSEGTGMGKTAMAQSLALAIDAVTNRIQGEPTMMSDDITGSERLAKLANGGSVVVFEPGPIFAHIVLFDEASRAHPKGKASLMEGGEERSVTCKRDFIGEDGTTKRTLPLFPLSGKCDDFESPRFSMILFTQNPIEEEDAAYPDPKGQVDRITLSIPIDYPSREEEKGICSKNVVGKKVEQASNLFEILACAQYIYDTIKESEEAAEYRANLIQNTRPEQVSGNTNLVEYVKKHILKGISPRTDLHLEAVARTWAFFDGKKKILPEHIKAVAPLVLTHRLFLKPAVEYITTKKDVLAEIISKTPRPYWK